MTVWRKEHVERSAGTYGEKRRNMWREVQEFHVMRLLVSLKQSATGDRRSHLTNPKNT